MADQREPLVRAVILDPEDGEAGIVEERSGRVLARFSTLQGARAALHLKPEQYQVAGRAALAQEETR